MKNLKLAMICLCLALVAMVATEADAGRKNKPAKGGRTEKTAEQMKPHDFDQYPDMQFKGGTLTRNTHSGWMIGDTPLVLAKNCVITMEGEKVGFLEEGRKAIVMGASIGGTISAWSVYISGPGFKQLSKSMSEESKEYGPNPNVGRIVKPRE